MSEHGGHGGHDSGGAAGGGISGGDSGGHHSPGGHPGPPGSHPAEPGSHAHHGHGHGQPGGPPAQPGRLDDQWLPYEGIHRRPAGNQAPGGRPAPTRLEYTAKRITRLIRKALRIS